MVNNLNIQDLKDEVWKQIPNYGRYLISNMGRVKALAQKGIAKEDYLMKGNIVKNYLMVSLVKNKIPKSIAVHHLMGEVFLDHLFKDFNKVIDHINNNSLNNKLSNFQIISQRENTHKRSLKNKGNKTSKYLGVCWSKRLNKWHSLIAIKNNKYHLGYFDLEEKTSEVYQEALTQINNNCFNHQYFKEKYGWNPTPTINKRADTGKYRIRYFDKVLNKSKYLTPQCNTLEEAEKQLEEFLKTY